MPPKKSKLAMAKTAISTIGSVAAAAMVARSVARDYLPPEMQDYLYSTITSFINRLSNQMTMVIYEFDSILNNELYEAAQLYLSSKFSPTTQRVKANKPHKEKHIEVSMEPSEEVFDKFDGVNFKWLLVSKKTASRKYYNYEERNYTERSDMRYLELVFHRSHLEMAVKDYLPFVLSEAKGIGQRDKSVKLFTVHSKGTYSGYPTSWTPMNLDHPATFDTLAMDAELKDNILNDLKRFVRRREYYRKVGKAWKRGYLLYGPPGTGKSSLIAAMANYLNFNIYDLELTEVKSNSELRRLLVATGNRSILVVEDIDCSEALHDREAVEARAREVERQGHRLQRGEDKVTLSGFLNFIDGLWSSCGDERIIIFTTNQKEKLDPALVRPGRMDVHIHMSYCTPYGFQVLAKNYLGTEHHDLFGEIEDLIRTIEVTPAEVAEQLLKNEEPDVAFDALIDFLHGKREEEKAKKEAKAKEEEEKAKKEAKAKEEKKAKKEAKAKEEEAKKTAKAKADMAENKIENGDIEEDED